MLGTTINIVYSERDKRRYISNDATQHSIVGTYQHYTWQEICKKYPRLVSAICGVSYWTDDEAAMILRDYRLKKALRDSSIQGYTEHINRAIQSRHWVRKLNKGIKASHG